jgi:exopolyphosphatase/guanosine-5'-triphosphate,3'-diphosphate pyrophosphatase
VDIGGGSTEVASAVGERPINLWSIALGAVRLTALFDSSGRVSGKQLSLMREYAQEAVSEAVPVSLGRKYRNALGSSGTIRAVVSYAAERGAAYASARRLTQTVEELVEMGPVGRRRLFEPGRADVIVAGAVILEALALHLGFASVTAVDRGLREGVLVDLMRRRSSTRSDRWLVEAAEAIGRRFHSDENHARQVARISLAFFDQLCQSHHIPVSARPLLEVAALLHDIGNAVSYNAHHKHTYYLINSADIPGLADREREIVARVARYHRRSLPEPSHWGMRGLSRNEAQVVRKLATLLRVADSLDRSHHQPIQKISVRLRRDAADVKLKAKSPIDLELWDVEHEVNFFRRVFRRKIAFHVQRR